MGIRLRTSDKSPSVMYGNDIMTVPANLAGVPALSLPAGTVASSHDGNQQVPVGMQLMAAPRCEGQLLGVAAVLEEMTDFLLPPHVFNLDARPDFDVTR